MDNEEEIMGSTPLLPFDNIVSNRWPRQYNGHGSASMPRYIGRVMMGSIPKMLTIVSSQLQFIQVV